MADFDDFKKANNGPLPPWVQELKKNIRWFKVAGNTLEVMWRAREGGPVSQGLAFLSFAGDVLDKLLPNESVWGIFERRGFISHDTCIGEFLCESLMKSGEPYQVVAADVSRVAIQWDMGVGAIYTLSGEHQSGPFIDSRDQEEISRRLRNAVQRWVWREESDLMITPATTSEGYRSSDNFNLEPMQPLGKYIGPRDPEWYAQRMRSYGDRPRTILLRGPTGVGKSVLARHIARKLGHGRARTMKLASSLLTGISHNRLLALVRYLEPTVLLLDDLDLSNRQNTETFLTILEVLRSPGCLVVVTMMTDPEHVETEPEKGSWHFPGMRPDRIDEMYTLYLPTEKERYLILKEYLKDVPYKKKTLKKVAAMTEGLSGAYLMEVARRLTTFGFDNWEDEVNHILWTAPFPEEEEEEGEEGVVDTPSTSKSVNRLIAKVAAEMPEVDVVG